MSIQKILSLTYFLAIGVLQTLTAEAVSCFQKETAEYRGCAAALPPNGLNCESPLSPYHEESCLLDPNEEYIPEIIKLTREDEIPKNLFTKFPIEKIARNLILRSYYRQLNEVKEKKLLTGKVDTWSAVQLQIAFHSEYFEKIAEKGFLNQFQTGRSHGSLDHKLRNLAEKAFIDAWIEKTVSPRDSTAHLLRPKYSFAVVLNNQNRYFSNSSYIPHYGNVFAQLKPSVKRRATMTAIDSLEAGLRGYEYVSFTPIGGPRQTAGDFPNFKNSTTYFEAQIFGPLSLDDVDYFLVGCFSPNESSSMVSLIKNSLERFSKSIQIYSCKMDPSQNQTFVPVKLLYPLNAPPTQTTPDENPNTP